MTNDLYHPVADIFPMMKGRRYEGVILRDRDFAVADLIQSSEHSGYWFIKVVGVAGVQFLDRPVAAPFLREVLAVMGFAWNAAKPEERRWKEVDGDAVAIAPWNKLEITGGVRVGYIYFIQPIGGGPIKIGFAGDPLTRLATQIQPMSPLQLSLLGVIEGTVADELGLHRLFSELRLHGEWFAPGESLIKYIESEAKPWAF